MSIIAFVHSNRVPQEITSIFGVTSFIFKAATAVFTLTSTFSREQFIRSNSFSSAFVSRLEMVSHMKNISALRINAERENSNHKSATIAEQSAIKCAIFILSVAQIGL